MLQKRKHCCVAAAIGVWQRVPIGRLRINIRAPMTVLRRCSLGQFMSAFARGVEGMQYLAPGVSEWPGGRIPDYVRELTTIAIAVISRDGQLVDANVGFSNLLPDAMAAVDMLDVRDLFAKPSFDRLVTRRRERSYGTLYSGIFNFGRIESGVTSLQGKLYTLGATCCWSPSNRWPGWNCSAPAC
ncbi:MAG: hypothetical protein HWD60_16005 [Defluviicoccus sp.]|nr:MAG: hypothetical protein HWD60_16005 [Defluviicoccus sp.]